jgi:hypothetical protein
MTPVLRVVFIDENTSVARSRIACAKHKAPKPDEKVRRVIDETWDTDLFCDDCTGVRS